MRTIRSISPSIFRPATAWTSFALAALLALVASCTSARIDTVAIENAKNLAKNVPALMLKATKAYSENEPEVKAIVASLTAAYDRAAATPKNKEVTEQYRLLRDKMVQPFLDRWKEKGKLDKDFVKEATDQVKSAIASIIRAEESKPK